MAFRTYIEEHPKDFYMYRDEIRYVYNCRKRALTAADPFEHVLPRQPLPFAKQAGNSEMQPAKYFKNKWKTWNPAYIGDGTREGPLNESEVQKKFEQPIKSRKENNQTEILHILTIIGK